MLLRLVAEMRKWETHCMACDQCSMFYTAHNTPMQSIGACPIGRAIILNLIRILNHGL